MDDRNARRTGRGQQLLDVGEGLPARHAAGARPFLDRFEERLGLVAEHPPVEVDQEQCRLVAVGAAALLSNCLHVGLVLLAQKLVPNPGCGCFGHLCSFETLVTSWFSPESACHYIGHLEQIGVAPFVTPNRATQRGATAM